MPGSAQTRSRRNATEAWIVIAGLAALWLALGARVMDQARAHDFLSFYSGAYMTSHGQAAELYRPEAQLAAQRRFAPSNTELVPFIRPPFYALLLAPLGWLPLRAAFDLWIALQIGALIACLAWAWRRFGTMAALLGCMSMPAAMGIAHGQDGALFLAVLIASYALAEKDKTFASGAVLGLLLVKFHLAPLWILAMMLQRRWKILAGFGATAAVAAGISLAMIGVSGVRAYAALLGDRSLAWLSPSPEFMIDFEGLAANFGIASTPAYVAGVALIAAFFLAAVWRAPLWRVYAGSAAAAQRCNRTQARLPVPVR